jgi:hypothetical protein
VALLGLGLALSPEVTIEPGVNPDPAKPFATQFTITNRSRMPIYNVTFRCYIDGPVVIGPRGITIDSGPIAERIASMPPHKAVTRACDIEGTDFTGEPNTGIEVTYNLPLLGTEHTKGNFSLKHGAPGYFLVPN